MNCNNKNNDFSAAEIKQIAQIKRFHEWLQADAALRKRLYSGQNFSAEQEEWLKTIAIDLGPGEISFLWKYPLRTTSYLEFAMKGLADALDDEVKELADGYPLLVLWGRYLKSRCNQDFVLQGLKLDSIHEKFNAWRKRRIRAAKSELGLFGAQIGHPVFAFELNQGCSVGCWFCSFASEKLSGTLDYPQKRNEVLSIVRQCREIFGKRMMYLSLPYYRTEPHDNPHYIDFLKDFEKETGAVLCTATAACNDVEWIKNLLHYYQHREDGQVYYWPRLSILTLSMLRKIHTSFTPMELKDIDFLIQVKDHQRAKVTGGRILQEQTSLRDLKDFSTIRNNLATIPQGTIACVTGFNINLLTRTIMIFSPCYVREQWPYGFRVFGQASYNDECDFAGAINGLIDRCMFLSPPEDKIVSFRDDIVFHPTEAGFDLATPNQLHHFKGRDKCGPLGELINSGAYTHRELVDALYNKHKTNQIIVRMILQTLFDDGFLNEVY